METNDDAPCSMLNVLLINLKRSRMKIHLYRIMYLGEHNMQYTQLESVLQDSVNKANLDFKDELLHGLMLYYPKYFILMLEGSEEAILRHVTIVLDREDSVSTARVLIMLRVNQRMLTSAWQTQLTGACSLEVSGSSKRQGGEWQEARNCVAKLHRLAGVLASRETIAGGTLTDRALLPESEGLSLLTAGSLLLTARQFLERSTSPPAASTHAERSWPPTEPM